MSHRSLLGYSVQRRYPFYWFTPVAIVGALISLVVNFASSGYSIAVKYSTNPNHTTSEAFFGDWLSSLTSQVKPACQAANVAVDTRLYTNNTALQYTLTEVKDPEGKNLPSLIYYNNPLENCTVNSIELQLATAPGRTATQFFASRWGVDAQAHVSCKAPMHTGPGYATLDLLVDYEFVPDTMFISTGSFKFLGRNANNSASLYWGESLLSMYYFWLVINMTVLTSIGWAPWISATIPFKPTGLTSDITSLDYYNVKFRAVAPHLGLNITTEKYDLPYDFWWVYLGDKFPTVGGYVNNQTNPNIWTIADSMAKSLESTILTDLGQQSAQPNILSDAELLQHFTANFSQMTEWAALNREPLLNLNITGKTINSEYLVGPAIQDYNTLKDTTGPLGVRPSTFALNYLCSVPQRKSTGSLLISLTVADLVFLQTVWLLFTFAICFIMRRRDPTTDHCEGCLERRGLGDQRSLLRASTKSDGSYSMLDTFGDQRSLMRASTKSDGSYTVVESMGDGDADGWHWNSFGMFENSPVFPRTKLDGRF